jgi:hypothetical protein
MKKVIITALLLFASQIQAQESSQNLDFRVGTGISLLGTGDMQTTVFENELNYKINNYIAGGSSINFGNSANGIHKSTSFIQGNLNLFFSPFKNNSKNDFRLGAGMSYYRVSDVSEDWYIDNTDGMNEQVFIDKLDERSSFGFNIAIEDSYTFNNKFIVGAKLYTQPYQNGDINSGFMLKTGLKI